MKAKLRPLLTVLAVLALLLALAACGAITDDAAILPDSDPAADAAASDTDSAADGSQVEGEAPASGGGLFGGGAAAANYQGPKGKVGKFVAGLFATLLEWLYIGTAKVGVPSWILSILLFAVIVRGLMQPLMGKQMRSTRKMQMLKPEIDEIKKRYANDQQKANAATMKLYKDNNCSPTAGCLPLLIQMPILIWLFGAIRTFDPTASQYATVVDSAFSGLWISDLAGPDPSGVILPLIVAASTALQQWLTTADRSDKTQRMMLLMMPVMFFFFSRNFPALMCFYWIFYSLASAGIMWPFLRKWEKADKAKIDEVRRQKEAEEEERRRKRAAAKEAYRKKKPAKAKKPAYEVQEGDLTAEDEAEDEVEEWDDDEEYEFDPEQDIELNFQRYLASNHIRVKEKKMKKHPYSVEAELVKIACDDQGKELDYDAMKRSFRKQYQTEQSNKQAQEQMAGTKLGKLFGLDKKLAQERAAAEEAPAPESADQPEDQAAPAPESADQPLDQAAPVEEEDSK